ncbi:cysteine desulfurase family protein [Botrimarina sp.]|uniref:cysteine desulfurase family protein n=1 Tax=Botrimarina sp. TaxID=2795802 RepID=UPI0032EC2971
MRSIYLDYNATTPLAPAAQEAMLPYLADRFADPSSQHAPGRAVGEAIEDARVRIADTLGAEADEIVFTSGATESCNFALRGLIEPAIRAGEPVHLIVSAVDHAAVQGPARFLARLGAELTVVPADSRGLVDPQAVHDAMCASTRLVSIVHANDEVGAVQPIAEIAAVCRGEGVLLHTDAAQTLGKRRLDVEELGVDLMSLSSHKAYGPKGVGALYVRRGVGVEPQIWGDRQELGQRAGTPNVAGVVGFAAAAALADESREASEERMRQLRKKLADRLLADAPDAVVYGPGDDQRLGGTLCVALPGVGASDLLTAAPDVCASPCAGGYGDAGAISPTLKAIGAGPPEACGAIRLSVGWYTDEADVDAAADGLLEGWERLRG